MGFMFDKGDRVRVLGTSGTVTARWPAASGRTLYDVHADDGRQFLLPGHQLEDLESVESESFIVELTITSERAADANAVLDAVSEAATKIAGEKQLHVVGGAVRRMHDVDNAAQWGVQDDINGDVSEPF